jgi:hypothetical protein
MNNKIKIVLGIFIIISVIIIVLKIKGEFLKDKTSQCDSNDLRDLQVPDFYSNVFATFIDKNTYDPVYLSIDKIFKKEFAVIKESIKDRLTMNINNYIDRSITSINGAIASKFDDTIKTYKDSKIAEIPQRMPKLISQSDSFLINLYSNRPAYLYKKTGWAECANVDATHVPTVPREWKWTA